MMPIRPVDPDTPQQEITMVAKHQPEFQTLPSIFIKDKCVCISRWALEEFKEYSERELLKESKTIYLYQSSNRKPNELCGHFLSSEFVSEKNFNDEMKYSNRVFYLGADNGYRIIFPKPSEYQKNTYLFKWELSDSDVEKILDSNSVFIYQFNLRQKITPLYVSLFENIVLQ